MPYQNTSQDEVSMDLAPSHQQETPGIALVHQDVADPAGAGAGAGAGSLARITEDGSVVDPAQIQAAASQQSSSRRRHPPATTPGLPYPHQRTQSLSSSRQSRGQTSSVIRHARNHTYSEASTTTKPVSSNASTTSKRAEDGDRDHAAPDQSLVTRYLRQFLQGCGATPCQTPLCASNLTFPFKDASEIAAKAVEAASGGTGELCPRLEARISQNAPTREIVADLDIVSFKALVDQCNAEKSYTALLTRLQNVFSSLSRLSMSFADPKMGPKNPLSLQLSDVQQAYWLLRECPPDAQVLIASSAERIMSSVSVRPDLVTPRLMKGILIIFMIKLLL
ncbi:hypothetical protein BG004_005351 [Podila humilis]|nr:hypothetical protein BG004_005351 [Podila humilis]